MKYECKKIKAKGVIQNQKKVSFFGGFSYKKTRFFDIKYFFSKKMENRFFDSLILPSIFWSINLVFL